MVPISIFMALGRIDSDTYTISSASENEVIFYKSQKQTNKVYSDLVYYKSPGSSSAMFLLVLLALPRLDSVPEFNGEAVSKTVDIFSLLVQVYYINSTYFLISLDTTLYSSSDGLTWKVHPRINNSINLDDSTIGLDRNFSYSNF